MHTVAAFIKELSLNRRATTMVLLLLGLFAVNNIVYISVAADGDLPKVAKPDHESEAAILAQLQAVDSYVLFDVISAWNPGEDTNLQPPLPDDWHFISRYASDSGGYSPNNWLCYPDTLDRCLTDSFTTRESWGLERTWRVYDDVGSASKDFNSASRELVARPTSGLIPLQAQAWNGRYRGFYAENGDFFDAFIQIDSVLIWTEVNIGPYPYPELIEDASDPLDIAASMTDLSIDIIEASVAKAEVAMSASATAVIAETATASAVPTMMINGNSTLGDITLGQQQFTFQCAVCHQANGQGRGPALLGPDSPIADMTDDQIVDLVRNGTGHTGQQPISAVRISDRQLASIILYIRDQLSSNP